MNIKIFISCNKLINSNSSLSLLLQKILDSSLPKVDIHIIRDKPEYYEYPALEAMYTESLTKNFYGLYLHCKGSSKTSIDLFNNNIAWAEYMMYGLIDNYETCLDSLNRGADLVGSMWYRHFKGNFFWFNSSYIRKLKHPCKTGGVSYEALANPTLKDKDRFLAEYWISQSYWFSDSEKPKVKNLFYLPINSDLDFSRLKEENIVPDLKNRLTCGNVAAAVNNHDYRVFDKIQLTGRDLVLYGDKIKDYMNFDCELERIDL